MTKKKAHAEEHPDETWLIPYADILTLLLALFIVMFAMSKVNQAKYEEVSKAFSIIFKGGTGVLGSGNTIVVQVDGGSDSGSTSGVDGGNASTSDSSSSTSASQSSLDSSIITSITIGSGVYDFKSEDIKMNEIKDHLEKEIAASGYTGKIAVTLNPAGLEICLQEIVLFRPGDADINSSVHPLLQQISRMFKELENSIKISGHTDNIPMRNQKYRSNWDLSAMRAINVMNYIISSENLNPARFLVQGYGEYMPKADNTTEEGRALNRRVEISVLRKYPLDSESQTTSK